MRYASRLFSEMESRRRELGMSAAVLARASGVSFPVVQRILSGRHLHPTWSNVSAMAAALGLAVEFRSVSEPEEMRESQARRKAERLMKMVQGTSALESQAVDRKKYEQMVRRSVHELLAGPARKLWTE